MRDTKISSLCILMMLFFLTTHVNAQYYGDKENEKGISFTQKNNQFFILGTTRSFGQGSEDFFIVKANADFGALFHIEWGSEHHDIATSITETSDGNIITTGYSWDAPGGRLDIVLTKFNRCGVNLWASYFGSASSDYAFRVIETNDKGFLITGMSFESGEKGSVLLIKTDSIGVLLWQKTYDTPDKDYGIDIIENSDNSIIVLANASSFTDKNTNSSDYLSETYSKIMLIKTDERGNELWRKFYGGEKHQFAKKIEFNDNNSFYIIGSTLNNTNGSFDISLHKIDSNGDVIWQTTYGGNKYEYGNSIDKSTNGNILITGSSGSFSSNDDSDIYVVKTDSEGNEIWSKTFGGAFSDYGNDGQFLSNGNITILGTSKSNTGSDFDLFFIELSPEGEVVNTLSESTKTNDISPRVYPNPTSTHINICLGDFAENENVEFTLYDISGKTVKYLEFNQHLASIYFDNGIAPGVYLYKVKTVNATFSGKIIVNN